MKKVTLTGAQRPDTGSHHANRQRSTGHVPCVLYGGEKPTHFVVDEKQLQKVVFTPDSYRIELDIDGNKVMALLHETQFDPVTDRPIHADFVEMNENKESRVSLSLKLTGSAAGVKEGGRVVQNFRKLHVKGLPSQLPEHLELDISALEINDTIRVSELKFEGLTVVERPTDVVVAIRHQRKEEEVAPAATAVTAEGAAVPAAGAAAPGAPGAPAAAGAAPGTAPAPAAGEAKKAEPKK
jgi:large subunit ribosomal protein L25